MLAESYSVDTKTSDGLENHVKSSNAPLFVFVCVAILVTGCVAMVHIVVRNLYIILSPI